MSSTIDDNLESMYINSKPSLNVTFNNEITEFYFDDNDMVCDFVYKINMSSKRHRNIIRLKRRCIYLHNYIYIQRQKTFLQRVGELCESVCCNYKLMNRPGRFIMRPDIL